MAEATARIAAAHETIGSTVDANPSVRSYQESHLDALNASDLDSRMRDLVILPSHLKAGDCGNTVAAAHEAGLHAICVSVLLAPGDIQHHAKCLACDWDERWTMHNPKTGNYEPQLRALGSDVRMWIAEALMRQ